MEHKVIFHLQELLDKHNIGQRELSKLADVRQATIHNIVHNKIQRVPVDVIEKVSKVLNIKDIREFMEIIIVDESLELEREVTNNIKKK